MISDWVSLGGTLRAWCARPDHPARGGIVVLQEIFGVNAHIRAITQQLAAIGYIAAAPELFHRSEPRFEAGYDAKGVALGRRQRDACTLEGLLTDIGATMDWLRAEGCAKIGCVGFCFGGHAAWLAGTIPGMAAVACFYPGGLATYRPGGGEPSIGLAPRLKARMLMLYGAEDKLIPMPEVHAVAQALRAAGTRHHVEVFEGASHGFACDERESYLPAAANAAWLQAFQLFADELKAAG